MHCYANIHQMTQISFHSVEMFFFFHEALFNESILTYYRTSNLSISTQVILTLLLSNIIVLLFISTWYIEISSLCKSFTKYIILKKESYLNRPHMKYCEFLFQLWQFSKLLNASCKIYCTVADKSFKI